MADPLVQIRVPPPQPPSGSATTVSGAAVKGVMKNAIVTAYELDDAGKRSASSVGSARTDSDGAYTLKLSDGYKGGLLDIEVTVNSETRMICDASQCGGVAKGQEAELPSGFKLSTIVAKPVDGNEISAPVTAWTTMAAKRTQALVKKGKSVAAAAKKATAEVTQLAGFNVANTQAKSVTNMKDASAAEQQAAVMNAVVAELVFAGGNASDQLEAFAGALDDDTAGNDGDSFKVAELAEKTRLVISATPGLASAAKDALNNQAEKNSTVGDGGFEPVYDDDLDVGAGATQAEKITAFKKFVAQARTWAASIEDLDTAALGNAVEVDVDTIQAAFANETVGSLKLALDVVNQSLETVSVDPDVVKDAIENGGTIPLPIMDGSNEVGEATLTVVNQNGLQVTITGTVNDQAQTNYLPFDLTLNTNLSVTDLDLDARIIKRLIASSKVTLNGTVSDNSGLVIAKLKDVSAQLKLGQAIEAEGGVNSQQLNEEFAAAHMSGSVELRASSGERFSGEVSADLARLTANQFALNDTPISIERLRVAGDFLSAAGNTFTASATLNINNAASFDTFAWLDYSSEERWVGTPVNTEFLAPLLTEVPESSVNINASVNVYEMGAGKGGYFDVYGHVADGLDKHSYYTPDSAQRQQLIAAMKTALRQSGLPETISVEIYDLDTGRPEIRTISLASAIDEGQLVSGSWDAAYKFEDWESSALFDARIAADIPELDGLGTGYAEVSDSDGNNLLQVYYSSAEGLSISAHGALAESAEPFLSDSLPALKGVGLESLSVNAELGRGSVNFYRPAELKYYEQCIDDPLNQLPLLGYGYELEWNYFDPEQSCAAATLSSYNMYGELDSEMIALLDAEAYTTFSEVYGPELAGKLAVPYYRIWVDGLDGYLNAEVKFPNLETAQNFIDASLSVSANVNIPDLPSAAVVATATRSSLNGGKVLANVNWNGGEYSLEVASDDLENATAIDARFFNAQGYELTLKLAVDDTGKITAVTGDALLDGEGIGEVTTRNRMPVITYPNGDTTEFETLF